jgi:hypothetical protein
MKTALRNKILSLLGFMLAISSFCVLFLFYGLIYFYISVAGITIGFMIAVRYL